MKNDVPVATMNFRVYLFVILIFNLKCTSGVPLMQGRIMGGHEALPNSHPYLVSLQLRFLWIRLHLCGGSILNEKWILSAAHCISGSFLIRWLPMEAIAGIHDVNVFEPQAQIVTISKKIPHPQYIIGLVGPHDIGLLQTKTPFTFTREVQPINLPNTLKMDTDNLNLSGWGALRTTAFIPALPSKLQEVQVEYVTYEECYKAIDKIKTDNEDNPLDKDANICSGPLTGGVAACNGDSGGPLVQATFNKTDVENEPVEGDYDYDDTEKDYRAQNKGDKDGLVILGIVSWGMSPCGATGGPTVYTKVSQYIDFINANIRY